MSLGVASPGQLMSAVPEEQNEPDSSAPLKSNDIDVLRLQVLTGAWWIWDMSD